MGEISGTVTDVVEANYHMFYLAELNRVPQPPLSPPNGLVLTQDGIAVIFVGTSTGPVTVQVQPLSHPPPRLDASHHWEEVVETSLHSSTGDIRVTAVMTDAPALPPLTTGGPGYYRIRVHVRGRDTNPDAVTFHPVETCLVACWPQEPGPEVIHKQTDHFGADLRQFG